MELNEHILLAMRWLQNNDSVSEKELEANFDLAYAASKAAVEAADSAYAFSKAAAEAAAAIDAAIDAYYADYHNPTTNTEFCLSETKDRLNRYFELTKEDREAYERQAKHLNVLGAKNE